MRLSNGIIAILVFLAPNLYANDSVSIKPVYLQVAFLYDFPESFGATAGIDLTLKSKTIHKANGITRVRQKDLVLTNDIGFYHNPDNYAAFLLTSYISQRHLFAKDWYFENGMGLGVMRTLYDGKVYTVDENETVEEHDSFGRFYGSIHGFVLLGYHLDHSSSIPLILQLKPSLWFQYPYNSSVLPHASVEFGIKYHFQNWNTSVKHHLKEVMK